MVRTSKCQTSCHFDLSSLTPCQKFETFFDQNIKLFDSHPLNQLLTFEFCNLKGSVKKKYTLFNV